MDVKKYSEIFKGLLSNRFLKTFAISGLIFLNFILANVSLNFPFIIIVVFFSYLGVSGILFRKSEKPHKFFTFINFFIVLQKFIAYFFLLLIIVGVVVQLYFKFIK